MWHTSIGANIKNRHSKYFIEKNTFIGFSSLCYAVFKDQIRSSINTQSIQFGRIFLVSVKMDTRKKERCRRSAKHNVVKKKKWLSRDVISGMCRNFYWTALWMNEHMIIIHKRLLTPRKLKHWVGPLCDRGRAITYNTHVIRILFFVECLKYMYIWVFVCKRVCVRKHAIKSIIDSI